MPRPLALTGITVRTKSITLWCVHRAVRAWSLCGLHYIRYARTSYSSACTVLPARSCLATDLGNISVSRSSVLRRSFCRAPAWLANITENPHMLSTVIDELETITYNSGTCDTKNGCFNVQSELFAQKKQDLLLLLLIVCCLLFLRFFVRKIIQTTLGPRLGYLLHRPSSGQFCVQTPKFVLWSHFTDSRSPLL